MPVLEAMACGLPVIVTAGGPTDEFCPDDACWRIARRAPRVRRGPRRQVGHGRPAVDARARSRRTCASCSSRPSPTPTRARAAAARAAHAAAQAYSWDAVAERYRERIAALAARPPRARRARPRAARARGRAHPPAGHAGLARRRPPGRAARRLGAAASRRARAPASSCSPTRAPRRTRTRAPSACSRPPRAAGVEPGRRRRHRHPRPTPSRAPTRPGCTPPSTGTCRCTPACSGHERLAAAAGRPVLAPDAAVLAAWVRPTTPAGGVTTRPSRAGAHGP